MEINIQVKESILQPLAEFPAAAKQAQMRALNRTAEWSRTRTLDAITSNLALKKSDLDGTHRFGGVSIQRATNSKLSANVRITGRRIPLFRFKGRPALPPLTRKQMNGITYQLNAGGGRQGLTTNAFVAIMKSGHVGFFKRGVQGKREKIVARTGKRMGKKIWSEKPALELYGPSIPHVAGNQPSFQQLLKVDASERLQLQMAREVNFILTGTSKLPAQSTGAA